VRIAPTLDSNDGQIICGAARAGLGILIQPLYIVQGDIAAGRLVRGQQLPTQRALAKSLGIDLTTVTRAYTEARRRGIMEARVGQGSFVSETSARRAVDLPHPVAIDLSMNVPPHPLEAQLDERIIAGMEAIRAQSGLTAHLNYQPPGGSAHEREVAARWMRSRVPHAQADRLVIFPGTQTILFNLLAHVARPGETVLTPFMGIGSEVYGALMNGRKGVGVELKQSYFRQAKINCAEAVKGVHKEQELLSEST